MKELYYIGLDIHKKIIAFCIKRSDGTIVNEGKVEATREALGEWVKKMKNPWVVTVLPTHLSIFHQPGYEFHQQ